MVELSGEIVIDRSPETVFDAVADERNRYDPRIQAAEKLTDGPIGVGTRFRSVSGTGRRAVEMTVEVTGYERPHRLESATRSTGLEIDSRLDFEPLGDGRTRMRWRSHVEPSGAFRLLAPVMGVVGRRQMETVWRHLKLTLEAHGTELELGGVPTYLAVPDGEGPWPGVVVLHDALGMTTDLRNQADRLADHGYLAAAPDLYHRDGRLRCMFQTMRALSAGEGAAFDDIDAVRRALVGRGDCTSRVGVIGFCMGGGFALALAPTGDYAAASANYAIADDRVISELGEACPIVASYGGRDRSLRGAAETVEHVLDQHGVPHDVREYPDAGHGFLNDHVRDEQPLWSVVAGWSVNTAYHGPSAVDARRRILAFFEEHLAS